MNRCTILSCLLALAVPAFAGTPPERPASPAGPTSQGAPGEIQAPATPTAPLLDVNAAEIAEGREVPAVPAGGENARALPRDVRPPVNPLAPQFQAVLDQERRELEDLNEQFARTADEQAAMAVQQRIRAVKLRTERRLLEIQLAAARASGDARRIAALEEAVAALDAPRPAPIHVERDVPDVHQH